MHRTTYKPGALRAALVEAATALIAEKGVETLSVTELTRRLGICSSAPYRHFTDRQDLLVAAAAQTANELALKMEEAVQDVWHLPRTEASAVEALAATAVVYATFVAQRRAGFELIFADELTRLERNELVEAGRSVIDVLLPLTMAVTQSPEEALRLMEHHIAAAHGLGVLFRDGFARRGVDDLNALGVEAARIARTLATAARGQPGDCRCSSRRDDDRLLGIRSQPIDGAGLRSIPRDARQAITQTAG